jgi:hypothetical protein
MAMVATVFLPTLRRGGFGAYRIKALHERWDAWRTPPAIIASLTGV